MKKSPHFATLGRRGKGVAVAARESDVCQVRQIFIAREYTVRPTQGSLEQGIEYNMMFVPEHVINSTCLSCFSIPIAPISMIVNCAAGPSFSVLTATGNGSLSCARGAVDSSGLKLAHNFEPLPLSFANNAK